jgi:hypothetical protein
MEHYIRELRASADTELTLTQVDTEGLSSFAKLRAVLRHVVVARRICRRHDDVLVVWPLLGWLELILWCAPRRRGRCAIVFHDPIPLRRQLGLGRFSALLARHVAPFARVELICHSETAAEAVSEQLGVRPTRLPHPFVVQARTTDSVDGRVLVIGQYKPARDLELMSVIGPMLAAAGFSPRVAGRGWPTLEGWTTAVGFLSAEEFTRELSMASCVLVPYKFYFQSGVAVQALELGVPVVGYPTDFLKSLVGDRYPGLVSAEDPEAWVSAVRACHGSGPADAEGIFAGVRESWRAWVSQRAPHQ